MLRSLTKPCKNCFRLGHTAFNCPDKPRKPLAAKKPMKKMGKIGKALAKQSREWRAENPPNHQGYYICYLCLKWIPADEMNVEHTKSKARHPEFRFIKGKLRPACGSCNEQKGSKDAYGQMETGQVPPPALAA